MSMRGILTGVRNWVRLLWSARRLPTKVRETLGLLHQLRELVQAQQPQQLKMLSHFPELVMATQPHQMQQARHLEELTERLRTFQAEMREHAMLLESAIRSSHRAEAERELRTHHPCVELRVEGVSIQILCWNHAGLLGAAIESALATLDGLPVPGEVLILDDASSDESRRVAQQRCQQDERIRLIASDRNLGLSRGRNVLLSLARYRHTMLLDADNQLVPGGVADLYASAQQTGAVLTYGTIVMVDEHGCPTGSVLSNKRFASELVLGNWIDAMALVRTESVLGMGGYPGEGQCPGFDDWELNLRLLRWRLPVVFVPTLVGLYRSSSLSMVHDAPGAVRVRRFRRMYGIEGLLPQETLNTCTHHSAIGYLWQSPGWSSGTTTRSI